MLFQVFLNRGLSVQQGQEFLARMNKVIDRSPVPTPGAPGTVKIPGVTRFDGDQRVFPDWLAKALSEKAHLTYDTVNLCYYKRFDSEEDAEAMRHWFDVTFLPWLKQVFFGQIEVFSRLQVRVMDEHESIQGASSY